MQNEEVIRESICEVGRRLWLKGWIAAFDGNISVRLGAGRMLITPSGVPKGFMSPETLILTDLNGTVLDGGGKPSSEILMHLAAYRGRSDIGAVVHAHPPVATGFAVARRALDARILPEVFLSLGSVPLAPYGTPSTAEVSDSIAEAVRSHDAILLANHGVVTLGKDVLESYYRMEKVEHFASISLVAHQLGGAKPLDAEQLKKLADSHPGSRGDCSPGLK